MLGLYITLGVLIFVVLPPFVIQFFVARHLVYKYFIRGKKEDWTRNPEIHDDEEKEMYLIGGKFHDDNIEFKEDVEIDSGKYHLLGEFYNFGFNKTAFIVCGRSEALTYSYFFATPYKDLGYNVLVIDNRSHGLSSGRYNSLGLDEWKDILNWAKFLHDEKHQEKIFAHGICIGSATILYALVHNKKENLGVDYFEGMVADGMYVNFYESFKNHSYEAGYKEHFVTDFFFMILRSKIHKNAKRGPIDCIDELDKPILFLFGKKDIYSVPEMSEKLYNKCKATKQIVWFDEGAHSRIKINAIEKYEKAITDFVNKNIKGKEN